MSQIRMSVRPKTLVILRRVPAVVISLIKEWIGVIGLRREVTHLKAKRYDELSITASGLRRALKTQRRAYADLLEQLQSREAEIDRLKKALADREASQESAAGGDHVILFRRFRSMLTQLPTLESEVNNGASIQAGDVLSILSPLDEWLEESGIVSIGQVGEETSFDPTLHRAVGRGARSVVMGDRVNVKYVGYRLDSEILTKAQVTLASNIEPH
ncbi:MAG: nucleotide exchange factor GrpE [Anaerolineae bacterium]|nr:nucleotide exchange factor GrpE [Anaerolineae bacterium]